MKRIVISCLLLAAAVSLAPAVSNAVSRPVDYRRTLFVPVAQRMLVFEAPMGMCFLDKTSYTEGLIFENYAGAFRDAGAQVLLAVFMDCGDVANVASLADSETGGPSTIGLVTWMNPIIGETTKMPLQDYLDMREASFLQYAEGAANGLKVDKKVRRTANGVSVAMSGDVPGQAEWVKPKTRSTGILATTELHGVPIEVDLRYMGQTPPPLDKVYPLMDKFMAQQVALNN